MSGVICSYQDCMTRRLPCSSIAFFSLPSDWRRATWIRNSGNKELAGLTDKQNRFLCEKHFQPSDMRFYFNRKTLLRHAVPKPHPSVAQEHTESSTSSAEDQMQDILVHTEIELDVPATESNSEEFNKEELAKLYVEFENDTELSHSDFSRSCSLDVSEPLDACLELDHEIAEKFAQGADESLNSEIGEMMQPSAADSVEPGVVAIKQQAPCPMCGIDPNMNEDYASDRHFALSLVNYFQRMGAEKKAVAKVKIIKYLTELEFGQSGEL